MKKNLLIFAILICSFCSCRILTTPSGAPLQVSSTTEYIPGKNGGYRSHYYISKNNEERVNLNYKNLASRVEDNPLALRQAKNWRVAKTVTLVSVLSFIGGLTYGILGKEGTSTQTAKQVGIISLPVFLIAGPLSTHFLKKTLRTYNTGF